MMLHLLNLLPIALLLAPLAVWAYLNLRTTRQARSVLAVASAIGAAAVVLVLARELARLPNDHWSASRLAPTLAMFRGYPLYPSPGEAPALVRMYGPVPWLIYTPAALARTPSAAMLLAACINFACLMIPAVLLIRPSVPENERHTVNTFAGAVLLGVIAAFACQLHQTAAAVTIDAPAIGFAAAACAVVVASTDPFRLRSAIGAGVLAGLAVWSKQTMWPLVLALPLYVGLVHGMRGGLRFAAVFGGVVTAVSMAFVLILGPKNIWFHMYTVPSSQPWQWPWLDKPRALLRAAKLIASESQVSAAVLALAIVLRSVAAKRNGANHMDARARTEWSWILPALVAALVLPTTAMAYAKVGGRMNNAAPTSYFLAAAAVMALLGAVGSLGAQPLPRSTRLAVLLVAALLVMLPALSWRQAARLPAQLVHLRDFLDNEQKQAAAFAATHPGEIYFPQHPLAALLAEGRADHFEEAVRDLKLAGFEPSTGEIAAGLPPRMRAIAYPGEHPGLMADLLGFQTASSDPALPGWTLFIHKEGAATNRAD